MKKFIFFCLLVLATVWTYFWYFRGINLFSPNDGQAGVPQYTVSEKLPDGSENGGFAPQWRRAAPLPTSRIWSAASTINGKIYVIGGMDGFGRTMDRVDVYDPFKDRWTEGPPLPAKRHHLAAVVFDGKVYAIGGFDGVSEKPNAEVFVFNPGSNAWTKSDPMPLALGAMAAVADDKGFQVFGGRNAFGPVAIHLSYDVMAKKWTELDEMSGVRSGLAAATFGDQIWVVGGQVGSSASSMGLVERWKLKSGDWDNSESSAFRKSDFSAETVRDRMYLLGGEAGTSALKGVYVFDPMKEAKWKHYIDLPSPRHGFASAVFNGMIFVFGGGQRAGYSVSDLNQVLIQ